MFNYSDITIEQQLQGFNFFIFYIQESVSSGTDINMSIFSKNFIYFNYLLGTIVLLLSASYCIRKVSSVHSLVGPLQFLQHYDMVSVVLLYITSIVLVFLFNALGLHLLKLNLLTYTCGIYLQPVLVLPLLYICTFGINTLLCLSLVQKKSIIGTFVNDCITLISFLLRFGSQYIRIILIVFVFVLFYEYLDATIGMFFSIQRTVTNLNLGLALLALMRIVFELCDCFFILTIQFNTFFVILLWLLSFLFVLKFNNIFEK